tara:strand:- start:299 stop:637 length:339 start_codon:yes stop_codon:yes gene_type:complete
MGTVETSPRPKKRPKETSLRPKIRPSEEEIANKRIGRIIERSNEIKKLIDIESEGLLDKTPLVPIRPPTGEPVKGTSRKRFGSRSQDGSKEGTQQFTLGGDVRHNPNRGKTY